MVDPCNGPTYRRPSLAPQPGTRSARCLPARLQRQSLRQVGHDAAVQGREAGPGVGVGLAPGGREENDPALIEWGPILPFDIETLKYDQVFGSGVTTYRFWRHLHLRTAGRRYAR